MLSLSVSVAAAVAVVGGGADGVSDGGIDECVSHGLPSNHEDVLALPFEPVGRSPRI